MQQLAGGEFTVSLQKYRAAFPTGAEFGMLGAFSETIATRNTYQGTGEVSSTDLHTPNTPELQITETKQRNAECTTVMQSASATSL